MIIYLCHLESRKTIHVDVVLVLDEEGDDGDDDDDLSPFFLLMSKIPTKKKNGKEGEHSQKVLRSSL